MKYSIHVEKHAIIIKLEGNFTFLDSRAFHHLLKGLCQCNDNVDIRMNVGELEFVDAAALAMLLKMHDAAKKQKRRLVFEQPRGQVHESLSRAAKFNALTIAA